MPTVPNPLKFYGRAAAAMWEKLSPQPDKITWLEKECLKEKNAKDWWIARPQEDAAVIAAVNDIYNKAGYKIPKIIIYDSPKANAMHLNNGTLCISTAKLAKGDMEAFLATVAHEFGHEAQNNLTFGVVIARFASMLTVANWATNKLKPQLEKVGSMASLATTAAFAAIATAFHVVSDPLWNAYRRWQEKDADTWSVKLTGSAEGMIRNLEGHAADAKESASKSQKAPAGGFEKMWKDLNRTHDGHAERIAHLREEQAKRASHSQNALV